MLEKLMREDCIEWTGYRHKQGYGMKWSEGGPKYVHRLVWADANGPIPAGMEVRHTCDNPPCYNLAHLVLGTHAENMQDRLIRGRNPQANKTHCINGHEFTPENTYQRPDGGRNCRACGRENTARWAAAHA